MRRAICLLPVVGLLLASPASSATFRRLFGFQPWSVSADGRVVVGTRQGGAFRWEDGVFTELAFSPGDQGRATAASADGSIVVGWTVGPNGNEAFRWENGVMTGLGDLPPDPFNSSASDVTADGTVIVGAGTTSDVLFSSFEAAVWDSGGLQKLSDIAGGGPYASIGGISADGSVMAGTLSPAGSGFFLYEGGSVQLIGDLPGGDVGGFVHAVSADGSTLVGWSRSDLGSEAFRYADGAWMGLGSFGGTHSVAYDASADGSVVVGTARQAAIAYDPFLWDATHGLQNLEEMLVDDFGVLLGNLDLTTATGISDDGLVIVGYGVGPTGNTVGWIATIPEPGTALLLLAGLGGLAARRGTQRFRRSAV